MRTVFIITISILHGIAAAQSFGSFLSKYGPDRNDRPWPRVPLITYRSVSNLWVHPTNPRNSPTVELRYADDADFSQLILRFPDSRVLKTYCDAAPSPFAEEVYSGDLNGDGIPDFVMVKPGSGCGLAAENCTGVFAFSEDKSYRFTRIHTMGLGVHSLVIDPHSKAFRLIHTSFHSGKTTDGRYHSFWVHRFFEWNGVAFCQDAKIPPVWIQYLYRPNHEPTKLLTPALKVKIWQEDNEADSAIEW